MKRKKPPSVRPRRVQGSTPTEQRLQEQDIAPDRHSISSSPSAAVLAPLSLSSLLQVDCSETAGEPGAGQSAGAGAEISAPHFSVPGSWLSHKNELLKEIGARLVSLFSRPVRRRQAVRRNPQAQTRGFPPGHKNPVRYVIMRDFRSAIHWLVNANTPWRYLPWAMSVAVAGYFIWRGPSFNPVPAPGIASRSDVQLAALTPDEPGPSAIEPAEVLEAAPENETADSAEGIAQELSKEAAEVGQPQVDNPFSTPNGLRPAVAFWQRVFGVWGPGEAVLHDSEHLGVVYRVVQLPEGTGGARLSGGDRNTVDREKDRLCATLNDLAYRLKHRQGLSQEQSRLLRLLTVFGGRSAVNGAAERVRVQRGMRNSFRQGLAVSGRYESAFRQVFRENRLPEDLVYLAHVESAFTSRARSPAGAVGVWQFMPETGRRFLRIDRSLDERYDPVLSTRGAARYFSLAYEKLDDWGLAITSYNHGLTGMLNAKGTCGTNIECVVQRYDAPSFGFASRNYYAEFLAIRAIVKNLDKYFPDGVNFAAPLAHKRIRLARAVPVQDVARIHDLRLQALLDINPALTPAAAQGRVALPADAEIWIPSNAVVKDDGVGGLIARIEAGTAAPVSH